MSFNFDLACRLSTERYRQTPGPLSSYVKGPGSNPSPWIR